MIVIMFALPAESSALISRLRKKNHALCDGEKIIQGKIDSRSVAIFHTGAGPKSCASKIDNLLRNERPDFLLSSGFAGSAREDLQVGDLILAENFSDPELLSKAREVLEARNPRRIKLFSSTSIIDSMAERNEIARAHGADAVDMETETIARACAAHRIRMLSLRVISDSAREPFPAPPNLLFDIERQRTDFARLGLYLMIHPLRIGRFLNFARRVTRAREALTRAIIEFLRALPA
jgi:adenosylhomocysteine nucleosidase